MLFKSMCCMAFPDRHSDTTPLILRIMNVSTKLYSLYAPNQKMVRLGQNNFSRHTRLGLYTDQAFPAAGKVPHQSVWFQCPAPASC